MSILAGAHHLSRCWPGGFWAELPIFEPGGREFAPRSATNRQDADLDAERPKGHAQDARGQLRPEGVRSETSESQICRSKFGPRSVPQGDGQGWPESISPGAPFFNKLQDPECDSCPIADILSHGDIENPTNIYNILIYHAYRFVGKPQGSKGNFGAFALTG